MVEEVRKGGFDFYLRFVKPLVINLPDPTDRVLAAAWIQKLRNSKSANEVLSTNYLKLLLFVLQRKRLIGPFRENPNDSKELEDFPANTQIIDIAKSLLQADEVDRRERLRGLIRGGGDEFPPYNIECSADLLEYAAAQDIPKFGVHAYYAISNSPITSWDNVDVRYLPKGVSLDKGVEGGGKNIGTAASSPEIINKSHLSMSDSKSKSRSKASPKGGDKSPGKSPKRGHKKTKSPLGSKAPVEDRSPPTWGSNLIEVTDPPDETAFNLSLASGVNKQAQLDLTEDLEASSTHVMEPHLFPDAESDEDGEPGWFKTPTEEFLQQFNNISIRPGTQKAQDIIDEVNQSLLQSGRDISLSQAEAEIDARYPDRRKDMPRTPPKLSKHPLIREAGQGIQYSPDQFGIIDDEDFAHGPSIIESQQYSPHRPTHFRKDMRKQRLISSQLEDIQGDVSLGDQTPDFLIDDIVDEVEDATRTPKNVQRKLKELLNEIEDMKDTTPALGGVPVTTPKRSPSPSRKVPSSGFNLEEEFALFVEEFPGEIESEFLNISDTVYPQASPRKSDSPTRTPPGQMYASPKTPSPQTRAARLRSESPPTPEKPSNEEFKNKAMAARKFLRPRRIEILPKSSGKKIKVYSKPAKHYKPKPWLNKIDESPEYRRTDEERFNDLYKQLIAEEKAGAIPISPPDPSQFLPELNLSPLSPRSPIDKYWGQNLPDESEDQYDHSELYETPKRVSPLKELAIPEQRVVDAPNIYEDVQFNFEYNPLDLGATAAMQNLFEGDIYEPTSPRTPPPISRGDIKEMLGSPRKSPKTPPRPRPSPIPSPQFYEMENILTPQQFQETMQAHEYTDRHITRDPERRLATELRTLSGRHIPTYRHAPRPKLETIVDNPLLEQIVAKRERENPLPPPSPLTPGLPWKQPLLPGNIRLDELPEHLQKKMVEPVPQRKLKEWEETVFESVVKDEDKDYFMKLFNEYNLVKEELIHPETIERRALRVPRGSAKPFTVSPPRPVSPPPPMQHEQQFPRPEMSVVPPPQVVLRPDEIPESWAVTKNLLEQAESAREERERRERREAGLIRGDGGFFVADDGIFETDAPLIDDVEFTFESPRTRAARYRPASPPTPEKPTYEELIANARAAKKKKRPAQMELGQHRKKHFTRPLRHYEPLSYLDRIEESPYVSPEIDWAKRREDIMLEFQNIPAQTEDPRTTPQLPERRGRRGIQNMGAVKPRKLKFSRTAEDFLPEDGIIPENDRGRWNKLLATLPELPPEPLPEDLMGQYYETAFSQNTYIIDKDLPQKHIQNQQQPLSPERANVLIPQSPRTPPVSPIQIQNMFADHLNQVMPIDFPEEIEGEIEPLPDPYAFMNTLPTKFHGFQEDQIAERIGTEYDDFTDSPVSPAPCMPCTTQGAVSPGSPIGLDTFFQTPPHPNLFERYPGEEEPELWMEYKPPDYFDADQYEMDPLPKPKSPPRPKTPPRVPSPQVRTPRQESPLPVFITPEKYEQMQHHTPTPPAPPTQPQIDAYLPYSWDVDNPKYKYVLTPTKPSPYKDSETPPGLPPRFAQAFESVEASPINLTEDEPFVYFPSPEYINENVDDDFDMSFASTAFSDHEPSPTHLTATPPSRQRTPPSPMSLLNLPAARPISQNIANWDVEMQTNQLLYGDLNDPTPEEIDTTPGDMYDSPVASPVKSCPGTPPTPPQRWAYEDQFASPTPEEFQDMMETHEYDERHRSRDPNRTLATKMLRTTTGNKAFRMLRHAPRPNLPTIFDDDESPEYKEDMYEDMDVNDVQVSPIPHDLMWQSPEALHTVAAGHPTRYDIGGYQASPERDFQKEFINMIPKRQEVRRNLFNEFGDDSDIQDSGGHDFTPPALAQEAWFESPETPPRGFSPGMQQRMQRTIYDGSAPYADYPELLTPPSGTRRRMRTYTPPGPPVRSPCKPTQEEMMQNIAVCHATPTPHSMGVHSRTGYIKNVPTRPVQEYYSKRMGRIEEVGEQYLTPPSGLRHHRKTYTPQATPIASPRMTQPISYTPTPIPSPYQWPHLRPTYTPPPHLRWSPLPITPSPPRGTERPPQGVTPYRTPARRQLFGDSCRPSPSPDEAFGTPSMMQSDDDDVFVSPELSPSRLFIHEQEIVYNLENAFADAAGQETSILDTSDIQVVEDDDFQW